MGLRHASHRFMPNVLVFPGGRVDRPDHRARSLSELPGFTRACLERQAPPSLARAIGIAAARELHEETGLVLGGWMAPAAAGAWGGEYLCRAVTPPEPLPPLQRPLPHRPGRGGAWPAARLRRAGGAALLQLRGRLPAQDRQHHRQGAGGVPQLAGPVAGAARGAGAHLLPRHGQPHGGALTATRRCELTPRRRRVAGWQPRRSAGAQAWDAASWVHHRGHPVAALRSRIPAQPGQAQPAHGAVGSPRTSASTASTTPTTSRWSACHRRNAFGRGIRLLARTTVEATPDRLSDLLGRDAAALLAEALARRPW